MAWWANHGSASLWVYKTRLPLGHHARHQLRERICPKTMERSLCVSLKDLWDVSHVPGSEPVQGHSMSSRNMAAALGEPTDW